MTSSFGLAVKAIEEIYEICPDCCGAKTYETTERKAYTTSVETTTTPCKVCNGEGIALTRRVVRYE